MSESLTGRVRIKRIIIINQIIGWRWIESWIRNGRRGWLDSQEEDWTMLGWVPVRSLAEWSQNPQIKQRKEENGIVCGKGLEQRARYTISLISFNAIYIFLFI